MSFRNNLQHLRATRNMTQEQLAMLLGVSRQSVTKWEAEKSYPEMDKLLKMCDLFSCTLDDLVQGDLTSRPKETPITAPAGPAQDVCGYDEHMRKFARMIPTGVAFILLGVAVGLFFDGKITLRTLFSSDALAIAPILIGVAIGLAFLIPSGMEHSAFVKAHPYIEDFYTESDKAKARRALSKGLIVGIAIILAGVIVFIAGDGTNFEPQAMSALLAFIAVGTWLIIHFSMMYSRTDVEQYNKNVADELEMEDIVNAQIEQSYKEALIDKKKKSAKLSAIYGTIMIVATIAGLLMLFLPALASPDPDNFNPEGTPTMFFWLAWPIGGMLCGIVALLAEAFGKKE